MNTYDEKQVLEDFFTFLKFKSISADPAYRDEVINCCSWVENYLRQGGFEVEVWETPGNPLVYAEWKGAGADAPTLLIYGHYDVQPVDPLEEWKTPPFEPTVRDGEVYARGTADNKGQILYAMTAVIDLLKQNGSLPLNVKFIVEGEEEVGSVGLDAILPKVAKRIEADYLLVPDVGLPVKGTPAVTLGFRGICPLTIELTGSASDLHSGDCGGVVLNPNHVLVSILHKMRDENGRVTIPGFYDDVVELTEEERKTFNFDNDEKTYANVLKAATTGGEKEYPAGESRTSRPTLEINGLSGGYGGPGFKTVIPAKAMAKVSCRLVPDQDPKKIAKSIAQFVQQHLPEGIEVKVTEHGMAPAVRCSHTSKIATQLSDAYSTVFSKPCQLILCGGSVPIMSSMVKAAKADGAFMGLIALDDQVHAPNEHFGIDRLKMGYEIVKKLITNLGEKS